MTTADDPLDRLVEAARGLLAEAERAGVSEPFARALERLLHPAARTTSTNGVARRFGMVGASPAMERFFALLEKVCASDVPVLVIGETGTGKELVARALHENGRRRAGPFVGVNCAAVPASLLESELFGHKRGAFTGAIADRVGHFASADGGTLFLDEIGDMPLDMQAKLLRALQGGEIRPVGSNRAMRVDVRVVAATNKDLVEGTRKGTFREDLYFRLAVVTLTLPPLREREGDVELLVRALAPRLAEELGRTAVDPAALVTPDAMAALAAWRWPGNVRELENELRRALALASGPIEEADLSPAIRAASRGR